MTTVSLSGVSIRSSCMRKNGAEPPPASGLRFCSTVNLTSSAVSSPQPSWNFTPERSLNVHVLRSFDAFHSVASPGRYSKVFASRMMSGSYTQSHSGFSLWVERHANGVSVPHCPTATTSRSRPCPAPRPGRMSGVPAVTAAALPARFRKVRRSIGRAMAISSALVLDPHVFVRRERGIVDRGDRVLGDARPDPHQGAKVHGRTEHRAVDRELLDLEQERLALADVALPRLLQEQVVDVGIAAVRVGTLGVDELLHPAGGIPRVAHAGDEEVTQLLLAPGGVEGRALHDEHLHADADGVQVVDDRLRHHEERRGR